MQKNRALHKQLQGGVYLSSYGWGWGKLLIYSAILQGKEGGENAFELHTEKLHHIQDLLDSPSLLYSC